MELESQYMATRLIIWGLLMILTCWGRKGWAARKSETAQWSSKEASGLKINIQKTMTMVFRRENVIEELMINSTRIENVTEFVYLGSLLTWANNCRKEIKKKIARVTGAMARFKKVRNSMYISIRTKLSIIRSCVMSAFYIQNACETWTMRKRDIDSLMTFEMKCYRIILHIHWQQK